MEFTLDGNGGSSAAAAFPPFPELIEEYCDRNPQERSKFICPVCGEKNLSVNMKTGKWNCLSDQTPEHRRAIADQLNDRYKQDHPLPTSGGIINAKPKSARERQREAQKALEVEATRRAFGVEDKCQELVYGFDGENAAQLEVEMAEWAKTHGHDVFAAKALLKEKIGQSKKKEEPKPGLADRIREVLGRSLPPAELLIEKLQIRADYRATAAEFEPIWELLSQEFETEDADVEERNGQIDRLLQAKLSSLRAREIISLPVASAIEQHAAWMNLREEVYLSAYMTGIGSVAKNGTRLKANIYTDFDVTPNFYTVIVAESSQRKSPVIKSVVTRPLRALQKDLISEWQQDHEIWEKDRMDAKKAGAGDDFKVPEPQKPVLYVTKYTGEAILAQAARTPEYGICIVSDEIAGYFKSANQYRGGAGADKEDLLSYYDGEGGAVLRVSGLRDDVDSLNLGIIGGIQPKVLEAFLGNCDDSNGNWARFSFIQQPVAIAKLPKRGEGFRPLDISGAIAEIYKRVNAFQPRTYEFTKEADDFFVEVSWRTEQRRESDPSGAMRSVWGKMPGRIAKYALNLHLEQAAANGLSQPDPEIGIDTLRKAIKKAFLDVQQIQSLYEDFNESEISSSLAKVIELSKKKGEIKARDVLHSVPRDKRPAPDVIRDWFRTLAEQGWGEINGSGAKISFTAYPSRKVEPVDVEPVAEGAIAPPVTPVDQTPKDLSFANVDQMFSEIEPAHQNGHRTSEEYPVPQNGHRAIAPSTEQDPGSQNGHRPPTSIEQTAPPPPPAPSENLSPCDMTPLDVGDRVQCPDGIGVVDQIKIEEGKYYVLVETPRTLFSHYPREQLQRLDE